MSDVRNDTGTRVVGVNHRRITIELPSAMSWHGDDGERRFLSMTPEVAADLAHVLERWRSAPEPMETS